MIEKFKSNTPKHLLTKTHFKSVKDLAQAVGMATRELTEVEIERLKKRLLVISDSVNNNSQEEIVSEYPPDEN